MKMTTMTTKKKKKTIGVAIIGKKISLHWLAAKNILPTTFFILNNSNSSNKREKKIFF